MDPTLVVTSTSSAAPAASVTQRHALLHLSETPQTSLATPMTAITTLRDSVEQQQLCPERRSQELRHESDENASPTSRHKCSLSFILASTTDTDAGASAQDDHATRPLERLACDVPSPFLELYYESLSTPASGSGHSLALGYHTPATDCVKVKRRRTRPSARPTPRTTSKKKRVSVPTERVGDLATAVKKGSKYCAVDGCGSRAKHARRCWKHGGSVKCQVPDCANRAKTKGVCWSHGGGTICSVAQCGTIAVSNSVCWAHGGGKRCVTPGCSRPAYERTENLCGLHFEDKHGFPFATGVVRPKRTGAPVGKSDQRTQPCE